VDTAADQDLFQSPRFCRQAYRSNDYTRYSFLGSHSMVIKQLKLN